VVLSRTWAALSHGQSGLKRNKESSKRINTDGEKNMRLVMLNVIKDKVE